MGPYVSKPTARKSRSLSVCLSISAWLHAQPGRWKPGTKHLSCMCLGFVEMLARRCLFLLPGQLVRLLELEARLSSDSLGHLMLAAPLEPPTPRCCSGSSRAMQGPRSPTLPGPGAAAKDLSAPAKSSPAKSSGLAALKPLLNRAVLRQPRQSWGCCFAAAMWPGCVSVPAVGCQPSARFLAGWPGLLGKGFFSCKQLSPGARHGVRNWYHCSQ